MADQSDLIPGAPAMAPSKKGASMVPGGRLFAGVRSTLEAACRYKVLHRAGGFNDSAKQDVLRTEKGGAEKGFVRPVPLDRCVGAGWIAPLTGWNCYGITEKGRAVMAQLQAIDAAKAEAKAAKAAVAGEKLAERVAASNARKAARRAEALAKRAAKRRTRAAAGMRTSR